MHYNAVLLEDIKSKIALIIEGLEATRLEFDRRFAMMERALHALKEDIINLDHRTSSKFDKMSSRCSGFERRISSLESTH